MSVSSFAACAGEAEQIEGDLDAGVDVELDSSVGADLDASVDAESEIDPYVPPDADPIEGVDFEWVWVDVPGSICRDGSPTGFGVNMNSASKKVMLYYEGGGACYNAVTCGISPINASGDFFAGPQGGLFNRDREENPVKDWNFVYFPYCSGDVYGGNALADPGIGEQHFYGYRNVGLFLDRVAATFPEVTHVFAAGLSAGAIGVGTTSQIVAEKFPPDVKYSIVADSCAPMDAQFVPGCLQKQWRDLWGLDTTFLADCGSYCPDYDNFMIDIVTYLLAKFEDRDYTIGFLTSTEDAIIRFFYGYGNNECNPENPVIPSMPSGTFAAGVMDLRNSLDKFPQAGTYFIAGEGHGYLSFEEKFFNSTVDGVPLVDWMRDIIEGNAYHVGP